MQHRSNQRISYERAEIKVGTFCTTSDVGSIGRVADTGGDATLLDRPRQRQSGTQHAQIAADMISASIAHELSQPLTTIITSLETCLRSLRKDPPDIAAGLAASERAVSAGLRASRLFQATRDLMARRRQRHELVDIVALAKSVVALCQTQFDEAGATVTMDAASTVRPIVSDSVALEQVLINLITNALHAMAETSTHRRHVHIYVDAQDNGHVWLAVRDSGSGIAPAVRQRLFDPFFTTKETGSGLGLTISRMAVEACGGRLIARNHPEGGAIFECLLPRMQRRTNAGTRSTTSTLVSAGRMSRGRSASNQPLRARQS